MTIPAAIRFLRLLGKALRHPDRVLLRLVLRRRLARGDENREREHFLDFLSRRYGVDAHAIGSEYRESVFAARYRRRLQHLAASGTPHRMGTTGPTGCEALYVTVRAARPAVVVETGVLYGASSAHILAAMEKNGTGLLKSIEIGNDAAEPSHDYFVPRRWRDRWELILGDARRELAPLLRRLGHIDLFHHDSLHTSEHMRWEFETALRHLAPGGLVTSHDVLIAHSLREIRRPNAFARFCERHAMEWRRFRNFGVAHPATPA